MGVLRTSIGPDGAIYVGGLGAGGNWGQSGKLTYGLQMLRPTGQTAFEMKSMEVVEGGFKITYTEPLSAETLTDLASKYELEQWHYKATQAYGGPKLDQETLQVTSATPSADGTSVTVMIDGMKADRVVHLRSPRPFASADGDQLWNTEAWYTLNSYPGYVAPPAPPAIPGLYELEDATLGGTANAQTEHAGYSGGGYVGGFTEPGASITTTVTATEAGEHEVALRYANGPNPFQGEKTISMLVNGEEQVITLPSTGTWKTYGTHRFTVDLAEGVNTVVLRYDADDDGNVNLDFIKFVPEGGSVYEAEDGLLENGAIADTEHAGYTGTGFMGGTWNEGASTTMKVHAAEAGDHPATIRFANGPNPQPNQTKNMTVTVNGEAQRVAFPPGGSWKTWLTKDVVLPLELGENTVSIAYAPGDEGNVNIDHLAVRMPGAIDCSGTPVGANDTFDGDELDPCRWTVVNEVRAGYRLNAGKLEIDARPGDLSGGTTSAENLVLQRTPQADNTWSVETTVAVDGTDDYIQSGLVAYGDQQNYGKLVVMRHPQEGWVVELGKITGGGLAYSPIQKLPAGANTSGVRLKLASDGSTLTGQYSVDGGTTWVNVGAQPNGSAFGLGGIARPLLGLAAYNGTGTEVATFDDFAVTDTALPPDTCTPAAPEPGYEMLFDGTRASMDGWQMAGGGQFVRQSDCSILSEGGFGLWWHKTPIDYDYSLKLDWMKPGDDNSGVFVGFPDPGNDPNPPITQGHEIQIDSTDDPDSTTGALYNFKAADAAARDAVINPDGEWNSYEIIVEGDHIEVWLNGTKINEYDDVDPNRMNLPSHIGLQTHGAGDDVYFRNVQINNLEEADYTATVTASAKPGTVTAGGKTDVAVEVSADGDVTPTGAVEVRDGSKVVGTGTLTDGGATIKVGPLTTVGTRTLTVAYAGDDQVQPGTGSVRVVVKATPKAALVVRPPVVDANKARTKGAVKVTCKATGVRCVGTLTLRAGGKVLGTAKVAMASGKSGTVQLTLTKRAKTLLKQRAQVKGTLTMVLNGAGRSTAAVTLKR